MDVSWGDLLRMGWVLHPIRFAGVAAVIVTFTKSPGRSGRVLLCDMCGNIVCDRLLLSGSCTDLP